MLARLRYVRKPVSTTLAEKSLGLLDAMARPTTTRAAATTTSAIPTHLGGGSSWRTLATTGNAVERMKSAAPPMRSLRDGPTLLAV